jgi:ferredoxin/bacterioferritin-associated ferredoxin
MFQTSAVVEITDEKCVGCTVCVNVCPTEALSMVDRLAVVVEDRCTGCFKCIEACIPYGAIAPKGDPNPRLLHTPEADWDREAVDDLCARAYFAPGDSICLCTRTTAGEVAAAVLAGTHVVEELTMATGVRAVCGMWCLSPVMRILAAAGVETDRPAKDYRVYPDGAGVEVGIWSVPDAAIDKYPEYPIRADRAAAKATGLQLPHYPSIQLQRLESTETEEVAS